MGCPVGLQKRTGMDVFFLSSLCATRVDDGAAMNVRLEEIIHGWNALRAGERIS